MSSSPFIDKIHKHYKTETKSTSSSVKGENSEAEMAATNNTTREDERGFMKTENFVVMDPREANFQETGKKTRRRTFNQRSFNINSLWLKQIFRKNIDKNLFSVKLVERNPCPNGFQLVDPAKSGKKNQFDLVELASNIQKVGLLLLYRQK